MEGSTPSPATTPTHVCTPACITVGGHICTPACITVGGDGQQRYTAHGFPVIGVSDLLRKIGLMEPSPFWREEDRLLGTAYHEGCRLIAQGIDLDPDSVDSRIAAKLECFREFVAAEKPGFVAYEELVTSDWPTKYAGRADAFELDRVWEFKGGQPHRWHRFQATLYSIAHFGRRPGVGAGVLYVTPKNKGKKYRIVEVTKEDFDIVVGAIHVAKFKGAI